MRKDFKPVNLVTFKPFYRETFRIKNKSILPNSPEFLDVPNRLCHKNRQREKSDWEVRTYFEHKAAVCEFFVTLTFTNGFVPRLPDGRLAFCPRYIDLFIKRLRNILVRDYNLPDGCMSYFVVSEYGKTTHRPHHHGMFFFSCPVSFGVFFLAVRKAWIYGFSDIEVPREEKVLCYVSKYVCKDIFCMDPRTSKDDPSINGKFKPSVDGYDDYEYDVTLYNFHRQSLGYGRCMENFLKEEDYMRGYLMLSFGSIDSPITRYYKIPKYFIDRNLKTREFYVDETGKKRSVSYNNDFGELVKEHRNEQTITSILEKLVSYSYPSNLEFICNEYGIHVDAQDFMLNRYYNLNTYHRYLDPVKDFSDYIKTKRNYRIPLDDYQDEYDLLCNAGIWNHVYPGYEKMFDVLNEIAYEEQKRKQRASERHEWKSYRDKCRTGRAC